MKDTIIIGNGPAGISASLYLQRAGFQCCVIGKGNGALQKAERIENYYGLGHPLTGQELAEAGKKQALKLGAELLEDEVVGISWDKHFTVKTVSRGIEARSIILATGASRKTAKIDRLEEFEGKGVSYCAVCDAFFYKGKTVAVLGNGEYALHEANELAGHAGSVVILTNGMEPKTAFPESYPVIPKQVTALKGEGKLEAVRFADGSEQQADGLFIALGTAMGSDLARKLGLPLNGNSIAVDTNMATALPGVFAAGDCTGGTLQVSVAVGEGAKAGLSAIKFLRTAGSQ